MDYPRGGNFPRGYWICVDVDGNTGGGWGWDRERVDRLFSFLRKKGFSCGGGNCETLDWDWNFETWDREV